jgi:hypothetical protein
MIGDQLGTDILGAAGWGIDSALVWHWACTPLRPAHVAGAPHLVPPLTDLLKAMCSRTRVRKTRGVFAQPLPSPEHLDGSGIDEDLQPAAKEQIAH